jgi:predicted transcriptional regulator
MTRQKSGRPTEGELEILAVLWNKQSATVREVNEELSKKKDAGYTTTLKLMQIMHEKGLVNRNDSSKTHIYMPAVSRDNTRSLMLSRMIDNLFAGSSAELVMQALGNNCPDKKELEEISLLIESLRKK